MGRGGAMFGKTTKGMGGPEVEALDSGNSSDLPASSARSRFAGRPDLTQRILVMRQQAEKRHHEMLSAVVSDASDRNVLIRTITYANRFTLRQEKTAELKDEAAQVAIDIVTALQSGAKAISTSENVIEDRIEQLDRARQSHSVNIDVLLQLFHQSLSEKATFTMGKEQHLEQVMAGDQVALARSHRDSIHPMQAMLRQSRAEISAVVDDSDQSFQAMKESLRNKHLERVNNMQVWMGGLTENIEQLFKEEHRRYADLAGDKANEFQALKTRDVLLASEVDQRAARIEALLNEIEHWRNKLHEANTECMTRNANLREQRNQIAAEYAIMKAAQARKRGVSLESCKKLSRRFQNFSRQLQRLLQQSQQIITIAHHTSKEPQTLILSRFHVKKAVHERDFQHHNERLNIKREDDPISDSLHKRKAQVLLSNCMLVQQRQELLKENARLRSVLARFIEETTVPANYIEQRNNLLIINGRSNLASTPRPMTTSRTVVESADLVRSQRLQHRIRPVCC